MEIDHNKILESREFFHKTIYTTFSDAIKILSNRQKDVNLIKKIEDLLDGEIPEPLKKIDKYAINGKQVATPNFDVRWFLSAIHEFDLKVFFYEYHSDKFTSNNYFKHSLCQLNINSKTKNKKGGNIHEKINIVDFNKYDGKPLKDVETFWGENLINFHKKLFKVYNYNINDFIFYDGSPWLDKKGKKADCFYEKDLLLYICHGILFENFLLDGKDGEFTKNIFLPAFEKVCKLTGLKPLIVPIPPMDYDIEENSFWYSYDEKIKPLIKLK